jgi:hypothetical protein
VPEESTGNQRLAILLAMSMFVLVVDISLLYLHRRKRCRGSGLILADGYDAARRDISNASGSGRRRLQP